MSDPRATKAIRHFHHLSEADHERLFFRTPEELDADADRELLAVALGATLYMPGNRPKLAATVTKRASAGVCSMVLDLEDAVDDGSAGAALGNVVRVLDKLGKTGKATRTMLFVRVRTPECIARIAQSLSAGREVLTGFVIPKFEAQTGERFLSEITHAGRVLDKRVYCMPVLESAALAVRQTRGAELAGIADVLAGYRDSVLALRIGATDMCGVFGLRRDRELTIYDVQVAAGAIGDIVSCFGRADGTGFVITGPVWEYFADHERLFRPMLRTTPFAEHDAVRFRDQLVSRDLDALLRELSLDRANGLHGKTVIHPSHVAAVHALSVVTHEEYGDAIDVAGASESGVSGVRRSEYRNKMNEPRPHRIWAQQVLRRAQVFGVARQGVSFVDLLTVLAGR